MKKIALFAFTIVFAAALGVAYAGEVPNGITNFTGKYINTLGDLSPADSGAQYPTPWRARMQVVCVQLTSA
jgi:hypothetical protein